MMPSLNTHDSGLASIRWELLKKEGDISDNRKNRACFPNRPKILNVEDNAMAQQINYDILTEEEYNVHIAKSYKQALRLYRTHNYDLILLDVCLPGKSGLDLCCKIREIEKNSDAHTPILALTACGEFAKDDSYEAGVDDFAIKPLRQGELEQYVAKWL